MVLYPNPFLHQQSLRHSTSKYHTHREVENERVEQLIDDHNYRTETVFQRGLQNRSNVPFLDMSNKPCVSNRSHILSFIIIQVLELLNANLCFWRIYKYATIMVFLSYVYFYGYTSFKCFFWCCERFYSRVWKDPCLGQSSLICSTLFYSDI